jgi:hypothetical protein
LQPIPLKTSCFVAVVCAISAERSNSRPSSRSVGSPLSVFFRVAVGGQVAMAVVVLVGAGLLMPSLQQLLATSHFTQETKATRRARGPRRIAKPRESGTSCTRASVDARFAIGLVRRRLGLCPAPRSWARAPLRVSSAAPGESRVRVLA